MQSTFELANNIMFEEKIDIEDLVLTPKQKNATPIIENVHFENGNFQSGMVNEISKLFEEFDLMSLHDYDQMRVEKVRQLFENYYKVIYVETNSTVEMLINNLEEKKTELSKLKQEFESTNHQMSIENTSLKSKMVEITEEHKVALILNSKTMNSIVKMHEKSLEDKNLELKRVSEELQNVKSANSELSKRIQELDIASDQLSEKKKSKHSGFQTLNRKEVLEKYKQNLNKKQNYENQKVSRNKKITVQNLETPGEILPSGQEETSVGVSVGGSVELSRNERITSGKTSIEFIAHSTKRTAMISQDAIGDNEKKLKPGLECEICRLGYSDSCNKERHIKTVHDSKKPYSSTKIHETIRHLPKLQNQPQETIVTYPKNMTPIHEKKIQPNSKTNSKEFNSVERPKSSRYPCKTCGLNLRNGYDLKVHNATVHEKERKFSCKFCTKKFAYGNSMKRHIETVNESKTYPCSQCGKQLGSASAVSVSTC